MRFISQILGSFISDLVVGFPFFVGNLARITIYLFFLIMSIFDLMLMYLLLLVFIGELTNWFLGMVIIVSTIVGSIFNLVRYYENKRN